MDRGLYVAMTGAKQIMQAQAVNNHNIANINTIGFRADAVSFVSQPIYGPGYATRVNAVASDAGTDFSSGVMQGTGRDLDVAVNGNGYIAVRGNDGKEAYTRAGDLRVNVDGAVTTAAGLPVLSESGPLNMPPATTVTVGNDGTISVLPLGLNPIGISPTDRIKLVNPPEKGLQKGERRPAAAQGRQHGPERSECDGDPGRARVEQRQRRAIADQHDRAAAPVRLSGEEHELERPERTEPPNR